MTAPLAPRSLDDDTPAFVPPTRSAELASTPAASTGTYALDGGPRPGLFLAEAATADDGPLPSLIVTAPDGTYWLWGHTVGCVPVLEAQVAVMLADNLRWVLLDPPIPVPSDFPTRTPIRDRGRILV